MMDSTFPNLVDDAFITLRFAQNLSNGLGFVWNPGEPPVEGSTSLLYLSLLAALNKMGFSLITLMPFIGVGATLVTLMLIWKLGNILNPSHPAENLFILILISISPPVLYWQSAGLETPIYSMILIGAILCYLSYLNDKIPAWGVGIIFSLLALTRPEGVVLFGVTIAFECFYRFMRQHPLIDAKLKWLIAWFMLIYAPIYIWKWVYFGWPFPNTYYVKTGGGITQIMGGLDYLLENSIRFIFPAIGIPLALLILRSRQPGWLKKISLKRAYIGIMAMAGIIIITFNGGDHFEFGRFLVPVIPLVIVATIDLGFSELFDSDKNASALRPIFLAITLGVAMFYWEPWNAYLWQRTGPIPQANPNQFEYLPSWETSFILSGKTLSIIASEDSSIAVVPIGAIAYYSNLNVIDMVGLVDPVIAHEPFDPLYTATWRPGHDKGNGSYILFRQPDYIQLVDLLTSKPMPEPDAHALQYKSIVEIWESPTFHTLYEFYPVQTTGGWYCNFYRRNEDQAVSQPE
jgi:hypothetical protein